jgi:hypothetical protein
MIEIVKEGTKRVLGCRRNMNWLKQLFSRKAA